MALVTGKIAIVFQRQLTQGVMPADLLALLVGTPATLTENDGLVLGSTTAGVGESGIDYALTRSSIDTGTTADGLTRKFDGFLDAQVSTLTFAFPMSGNKQDTTVTPAAADFQFTVPTPGTGADTDYGIGAIYSGCGLGVGLATVTPGWEYRPEAAEFIACLIYDSGMVYPFIDLKGSLDMGNTPGESGVQTATFTGKLYRDDTVADNEPHLVAFPTTLNYGQQDQVAAPTIELGGNQFGTVVRGWSDLTITIDNQIGTTPDCNQSAGARVEQGGREVGVALTLDIDGPGANESQDYENLVTEVAKTDAISYVFGTQADVAGGGPATAYQVVLFNVNIQDMGPAQPSKARANTLSAFATGTVDGGDLGIEFF